MKRAVLLLSMLLLLLLCGCGPQKSGSDAAATQPPMSSAVDASAAQASVSDPKAPDAQPLTIDRTEHNRYITEAIETFNRLSPATPLESIWYTDNENELKLALIAGDGPDLISLDGFDYEIYADKGVFCNLYDWLDAAPDLSGDALLSPILRSMEWSDHTLYQLSPSFYLQSMYVSPEVWDPDQPFPLPNIARWMDDHPDAAFTVNAATPGDLQSLLLDGCMSDMEETPASVTETYRNPADAALGGNTATVTVTTAPVRGLTQAEIDKLNDLVEQVSSFGGNTNVKLRTIIFDEVAGYFSGQKSAEAVADVIQNRAGIYLSEQQ